MNYRLYPSGSLLGGIGPRGIAARGIKPRGIKQGLEQPVGPLVVVGLQPLQALEAGVQDILFHNEIDVEAAREAGLSEVLIDRLVLTEKSLKTMAQTTDGRAYALIGTSVSRPTWM